MHTRQQFRIFAALMSNYTEYKQLDLPGLAEQVLKRWEADQVFKQSITSREGKPTYTFYEGPPSANGRRPSASGDAEGS